MSRSNSRRTTRVADARKAPRLKLPAMYTLVRVRPAGQDRYCWTGYIYDISESGMRFELDQELPDGTDIEVRAMLPGHDVTMVRAAGKVVRRHDDIGEPGPVRMGMTFNHFTNRTDRTKLHDYLEHSGLPTAA